ncbi:exodeoxyribonuclease VII large subunit [Reinekea marina]|uniref:Exodeoxyribonuclease 7 large subunit n=1 Tax=Reinekea marina TaxID=1310421 RepID=A0ABV7WT78_9GAMM|nr:exodeoxyribonuclease VII large subunit [Reinekea marina]MDN3649262.1 exodeoxyribonuclease VII large subunit [Reinekea marina]
MSQYQPSAPLTVFALNRQVKQLLESQYPMVPVQGEISTLSKPASGHIYFTLKDSQAQIRCAMFKGSLAKNTYKPKVGDEVLVYGRLSLYEGRGDYQLIVSSMQPRGEGALQAAFFQLKEKLSQEGLFDETNKQPLPKAIKTVGLVTSSTGAALHDVISVLKRRYPLIELVLYPSQVQGKEATATIVEAIATANRRNEVDVLIVGRGGGSLEDLWCFNTEAVARAIYQSSLPIISAVGHEVDTSISDFVADVRAATPSQAAELVSPDQYELIQRFDAIDVRLKQLMPMIINHHKSSLDHIKKRLRSPLNIVLEWRKSLVKLSSQNTKAAVSVITQKSERLTALEKRLHRASPMVQIASDQKQLKQTTLRLNKAIQASLQPKQARFAEAIAKLNVLSPLSTLERGYSITLANNHVVTNAKQLNIGDTLETRLQNGIVHSTVSNTTDRS